MRFLRCLIVQGLLVSIASAQDVASGPDKG
jgi:hypothetical protein